MLAYIGRRLMSMVPTFLLAAVLVFFFMHLIPGDPAAVMLGDMATVDQIEALRESMGLNKPILVQFGIWFFGVLRGDLGRSVFYEAPVARVIASRAETSLLIAGLSMTIIILVGIPIGILSAVRYNSALDQLFSGLAMFGASIPTFWLGLNLMLLFAVVLRLLPSSGFPGLGESGGITNLRYLVLPCVTLAAPNSALIIRLTRSSMLDIMREDYVTTARAKGLDENVVIWKHAVRNAINPLITLFGFTLASLLSGSFIVEIVMNWPGLGSLTLEALLKQDLYLVMGSVVIAATMLVLGNLIADVLLALADPRIKYD